MTQASQMHASVKACELNWRNGKLFKGDPPAAMRGQTSVLMNWNKAVADTQSGSNHPAENATIRIFFMTPSRSGIWERVVKIL